MHKPNPISLAAKASGEPELREVGVGPWTQEHPGESRPDDPKSPNYDRRYDTTLLDEGDRRNVLDRYRYWTVNAIRDDLDAAGRHGFEVAIENWTHDFNIGSMVRTANAFTANRVHIVGPHKWNRKGSLMTELYQHVEYHPSIDELVTCWKLRIAGEIAAAQAQAAAAAMHAHQAHSDASALLSDDDESNGSPRFASATGIIRAMMRSARGRRSHQDAGIVPHHRIGYHSRCRTDRNLPFPERCLMLFGAEGPGLSNKALELADDVGIHLAISVPCGPSTPAPQPQWPCTAGLRSTGDAGVYARIMITIEALPNASGVRPCLIMPVSPPKTAR